MDGYAFADSNQESEDDPNGEKRDSEGVDKLYWDNLIWYKRGQLLQVYVSEIGRLHTDWIGEFNRGGVKIEFEIVVSSCDDPRSFSKTEKWLDSYKKGENVRFKELLYVVCNE